MRSHIRRFFVVAPLCVWFLAQPAAALDLNNLFNQLNNNPDLVNAIGSTVKNLSDANRTIGPKEEQEIGNGLASNMLGAAPLVADASLQRYVNDVGVWVASQSEAVGVNWRFGVIDTNTINSFAMPGGIVFITRGLLAQMHSEAELACVLGHETTHVLRHHHVRAIQSGAGKDALGNALQGVVAYKGNQQAQQIGANLASGFSEVYVRGLDKDDEFAADITGMVLCARAGYNPYALPAVLQTLDALNPQDSNLQLMFSTHPSPRARLDKIDQVVGDRLEPWASGTENTSRFNAIAAKYGVKTAP
ncbi:M48 family metalloprotease [Silvimonas sp.]|uniref:M48 family metalloprotease n=1 Tax=Silvimonas sp. TaxID=2650811 RepID=UPI002846F38C|nr:M48 family metalloprotease [Silvimonas sp.]MDR3428262.1 M48 family metalloprotease [Silvimonas sp.]